VTESPRVVVVGARSARQGIGEFVAGWFARSGAEVTAIVGTTPETVAMAQAALHERYAIECRGYTDLGRALAEEPAEIVAICSPYRLHAEQLLAVSRAGRHCLCEKPLCWPPPAGQDPIAAFVASGTWLDVVTQWPCTLPTYYALHPGQVGAAVLRFEMRLSPISSGLDMVPDAVPHFVSMLRTLVGPAEVAIRTAKFLTRDQRQVEIACDLDHARGRTRAIVHLETCTERPRPAWYAINGARVDREVDLPSYEQFFRAGDRRIALSDPLGQLVQRFLADVAANRPTEGRAHYHDRELLTMFYGALEEAP